MSPRYVTDWLSLLSISPLRRVLRNQSCLRTTIAPTPTPLDISVLPAVLDARIYADGAFTTGQERFRSMVSVVEMHRRSCIDDPMTRHLFIIVVPMLQSLCTISHGWSRSKMYACGWKVCPHVTRYPHVDSTITIIELRKNTDFPELAIYIVGSKADLRAQRQVTPDRARQALHRWFPPPRRPSPPPTPVPTTSHSLASYIRPRFTSITSYGAASSGSSSGSAHRGPGSTTTATATNLARANTTGGLSGPPPSSRPNGARHNSLHSVDATPSKALLRDARPKTHQREKSWAGAGHPPNNMAAFSFPNLLGASKPEWDPQEAEEDSLEGGEEPEWGLGTNMHLFEVSAKDSSGMATCHRWSASGLYQYPN